MSKLVIAVVVASILLGSSVGRAQTSYVISLNGNMNSSTPYSNGNSTGFTFFPFISVKKDGSPSTAFVKLSSPGNAFIGWANNPSNNTGQSNVEPDTANILSHANGQWTMEIQDGANTFDYLMDVAVALPFDNLPVLSSPELVNGGDYPGTFHFGITGGSANYPGPLTQVRGQLFSTDFNTNYANDLLASGATSWTPSADLSGVGQVLAFLRTSSEATDTASLSITNIRPATRGLSAPGVSFDATTLLFSSDASAQLNAPEPASIAWIAIGALSFMRKGRSRISRAK